MTTLQDDQADPSPTKNSHIPPILPAHLELCCASAWAHGGYLHVCIWGALVSQYTLPVRNVVRACHNHATAREHPDAHVAHFPLILINVLTVLCCECDNETCVVPGLYSQKNRALAVSFQTLFFSVARIPYPAQESPFSTFAAAACGAVGFPQPDHAPACSFVSWPKKKKKKNSFHTTIR